MTVTATYPRLSHDWLKHETDVALSREVVTIKAAAGKLDTGMVLGKITVGAASSAAKSGGNTGNGALTLDATTPVLTGAKAGVYAVRAVGVAANGASFSVTDPDGFVIGNYTIGGPAFATGIKFAIADGATDFVLGDGFDITVAAGSGKYVACDLAAVDGSQVPAALLKDYTDASGVADVKAVAIVGFAEVVMAELAWHASINLIAEKRAVMATLAAKHIKNRAVA